MHTLTALVVATLAAVVVPPAADATPGCGKVQARGRGWTSIALPVFPARTDDVPAAVLQGGNLAPYADGGQTPAGLAVDQWDPRVLYVTNAKSVLRSADGGCTWRPVFDVLDYTAGAAALARPDNPQYAVVSLRTPPARAAHRRVHLLLQDRVSGRLATARSETGTGDWTFAELPTSVWEGHLAIAPGDPNVLYVSAMLRAYGTQYFRSDDAGRTWKAMPAFGVGDYRHQSGSRVVVSPLDPHELWDGHQSQTTYGAFRHSVDGGQSWTAVPVADPNMSYAIPVAAFVPPGSKKVHVYAIWQGARLYWSEDGGRTFAYHVAMAVSGYGHDPLVPGSNPDSLFGGYATAGAGDDVRMAFGYLSRSRLRSGAKAPWVNLSPHYRVGRTAPTSEGIRGVDLFVSTALSRRTFLTLTPLSIERYDGKS